MVWWYGRVFCVCDSKLIASICVDTTAACPVLLRRLHATHSLVLLLRSIPRTAELTNQAGLAPCWPPFRPSTHTHTQPSSLINTHLHQLLAGARLVKHALGVLRKVHPVVEAQAGQGRFLRACFCFVVDVRVWMSDGKGRGRCVWEGRKGGVCVGSKKREYVSGVCA